MAKLTFLSVKRVLTLVPPCTVIYLVVPIETLLYCIFYLYVNCVLTEHLAECERFKYFSRYKVVKSKIKSVPSSLFGLPFLYLLNVFMHERNEFICQMVNKFSKFKFTTQRLSDLVLTYSVGKGDFLIIPPSSWNLLSVTLWCLHPGHCYSSTHLLYNLSSIFSSISLVKSISLREPKEPCRDLTWLYPTDLLAPYTEPKVAWVSQLWVYLYGTSI